MKTVGCSIAFLLLLTGCMHIRQVAPDSPPSTLLDLNREISDKPGTVTLKTGEILKGEHFEVSEMSSIWRERPTREPKVFPNSDIQHIIVNDRERGLWEGPLYGGLFGAIPGFLLGTFAGFIAQNQRVYSDTSPPNGGSYHQDKPMPVVVYALGGALAGAIPGAALGLFVGAQTGSLVQISFVNHARRVKWR